MKLSKTWKIVIGILTAFVAALPIFFFFIWMSFMFIAISSADSPRNTTPDAFVYLFLFAIMTQIFWGFLRLAMVAFYQTHVILNDSGSKVFRILLSLGNFFLPFISMPIYYFIYIFPEETPNWALEQPAPVVEEIVEETPKPKKSKTKKKTAKKKSEN